MTSDLAIRLGLAQPPEIPMPFNCTISTEENARHPDGSFHMRITVRGPSHSGKTTVAGMLAEYYMRKGMSVRTVDPSDHPFAVMADNLPNVQVVIHTSQLVRPAAGTPY